MKWIFMLFLLPLGVAGWSQSLRIEIVNQKDRGVHNAHIFLKYGRTDTLLLSNQEGFAECNCSEFPLYIKTSMLGYRTRLDTIYQPVHHLKLKIQAIDVELHAFVVTAQYGEMSQENAVVDIGIISKEKIAKMGAQNIEEVLRNSMNIRVTQDAVLGSGITMQGLSGKNVNILVDGIPILGRQNGNIDLSQINLSDVARIEIVKGPLSVSYGTNALAGTINIITEKVTANHWGADLQSYADNSGVYNFSGSIQFKQNAHRLKLTGGRNFFDGWGVNDHFWDDTRAKPANEQRVKVFNPKTQEFGSLQYSLVKKDWSIRYQPSIFNEVVLNRGLPRAPYGEEAFDDEYRTFRMSQALLGEYNFNNEGKIEVTAAFNYYRQMKHTYLTDLTTLDQELNTGSNSNDTTRMQEAIGRLTYSRKSLDWLHYSVGLDLNHSAIYGKRFETSETQGDYAVFASMQLAIGAHINLRPGLRYSYNTTYEAPVTPALSAKLDIDNFQVRASYARGFRAPDLKELYFYFVDANHYINGNPNLKAEQSNSYSIQVEWKKLNNSKLFQMEFGGFYNDLQNLIALAHIKDLNYSYVNVGKYKTLGGSLKLSGVVQHLKWNLGYTQTGHYNIYSDESDSPYYMWSQEWMANASYEFKKPDLTFSIFYKYQGALPEMMLTDENQVIQTEIGAYHWMDLSVSKSFFNDQFTLQTGLKNLFDVTRIFSGVSDGAVHSSGTNTLTIGKGRLLFFQINYQWNS